MHLNFLVLYWACKREYIVWICESWGSMGCDEWDWISHANNQCWLGLQQCGRVVNPILSNGPFLFWYAASSPHFAWPPFGHLWACNANRCTLFIYSIYHSFIFWYPNLIPDFQNSNFHIYLFNHYYLRYYYYSIYLFLKFHF